MTEGRSFNSLRVLIVLLMTLALFPLGAVAIYQTNRVASDAGRNAQLALLAITGRAARAEEVVIERAFGAARMLANVASDYHDAPGRCSRDFGRFIGNDDRFSFVGLLPKSGVMTCSSSGDQFDFSGFDGFEATMQAQTATIEVNTQGPLSGTSVLIVSVPYLIDGDFGGFVSLSIPHSGLPETSDQLINFGLVELVTFNADGAILTARSDMRTAINELPADRPLQDLSTLDRTAFQGKTNAGMRRTFTVVPIQGSPISVLGIWDTNIGLAQQVTGTVRPWLFPVLMWFASMCVAMLSIYMLVLRHLTQLRRRMNAFATDRSVDQSKDLGPVPNEIQALYDHFDRMTDNLMRDEASQEDSLREKSVLIKEVHHRVKNNLQLISSIMNMQIRTAEHDETKTALGRLQERVLSLATIHRDLYQSQNAGMVNVGTLIAEVIENTLEVAVATDRSVDLSTDIDSILLYPDQAVPLSLLVTEAATNAMKYMGSADGRTPSLSLSLKQDGAKCVLRMSNSVGGATTVESTGLGAQLMNAFAIQLGGRIETEESPDRFTMQLSFTAADFEPEERDF